MLRQACHGVGAHETNDAACCSRHTIVDEEALLVMKPHSPRLSTPPASTARLRQIAALSAGSKTGSALTFAATHHALKFDGTPATAGD
jgi:D-tyrosyl-tRNA(Tyr) deacylase